MKTKITHYRATRYLGPDTAGFTRFTQFPLCGAHAMCRNTTDLDKVTYSKCQKISARA